MTETAAPISSQEFSALMGDLDLSPDAGPVAVAVSGGADSMALARLVADWGPAEYLTVDHGLRAESAREAARVGEWLGRFGRGHTVLTVSQPAPETGVQDWARRQRYTLLENWCRERGINELLIAHHQDDQAETFLLRLFRGSGVDGLAAIDRVTPPLFVDAGPRHVRPLLDVAGDRLRATLREFDQHWIEDPTNDDAAFARVRARRLLPTLAEEGLTAERMARTARRMRRARAALDLATDEALAAFHKGDPAGYGVVERPGLAGLPDEIGLRIVSRLLLAYGGAAYPLREEKVERLWRALVGEDFTGATLGGVRLGPIAGNKLLLCREASAIAAPIRLGPGMNGLWDRRYRLSNRSAQEVEVGALGVSGERPELDDKARSALRAIPTSARRVLPAFRTHGRIVAIPHLGFGVDERFSAVFSPGRELPGLTAN